MSDKDDFTLLNFGKGDENKAALENLKRELPRLIEIARMTAKIRRASYDAYISEGFTEEQALYLCHQSILP